ncbi:hypothetical protein [Streptomyces mirabilis]|uniref:hypothetical protein n=1 Tax=Streptomyces mirabilis TaxID=68239 RepID=UPI003801A1C8
MACKVPDCELCRPLGIIEWTAVVAWRMREHDDEGIGGVKVAPADGRSPFHWWHKERRQRQIR